MTGKCPVKINTVFFIGHKQISNFKGWTAATRVVQ